MNQTYPALDSEQIDGYARPIVFAVYKELQKIRKEADEVLIEIAPPYTFVRIAGKSGAGSGFAKCNPTDPFDPKVGFKLALDRAVHKFVQQPTIARTGVVRV